MAGRPLYRKLRVPVSLALALAGAFVVLASSSKWRTVSVVGDLLFMAGCVLVGIGVLGRLWCSLYVAGYKSQCLVTAGPYAMSRNPLYFSSLLGALGVGLATETLTIPLAVLVFFVAYYPWVIRGEEKRLLSLHGGDFESYRRRTPVFVPSLALLDEPEPYAVNVKLFRKHMFSAVWFIWLLGVLKVVTALHETGGLPIWFELY